MRRFLKNKRKGGSETGNLAEKLTEELNCKVVFTIPVGDGLPIYESVVVTWIVMAVLVLLSIILVRNLKVENPGKKQLALEAGYLFFRNFFNTENR